MNCISFEKNHGQSTFRKINRITLTFDNSRVKNFVKKGLKHTKNRES